MSSRDDPYLGFRFGVEIDDIRVAGFSEVSGLERQMSPEEYQEGGVNSYTHKLPTRYEHPNLVLERGLADYHEIWDWTQAVVERPVPVNQHRNNVRIVLQDSVGEESWRWECRDAYPVRWAGPELRADQGTVAMETLELAHRGLSKLEGSP